MRLRSGLLLFSVGTLAVAGILSCGGGGGGSTSGGGTTPFVAPSITTQPVSQTKQLGQTATFSVGASGNPVPAYQWSRNGSPINGAVNASYTAPASTKSDNGNTFAVVVTNSQGSVTSNNASLTVQWAPTITTHPSGQTVMVGQVATFAVIADANPAPAYQWLKDGQPIAGATLASYTTPATTLSGTGATFTVVVSNNIGSQTSNTATLTVNPVLVPPSITTQPESATVQVGQNASFSVVGSGTAPLNYQWRKNGAGITANGTGSTFSISAVQNSDAGSYDVIVNNVTNQPITSNVATLTVTPAPQAPSITTQPVDVAVTEGNSASFSVVAGGTAPLSYQWQKNQVDISGATLSTYSVSAASVADTGAKYRCHVTNATGEVYSTVATLTVNSAPHAPVITSFTANPTSITIGQSTTLAWAVTGANSLSIDGAIGDVTGLTSKQVTPTNIGSITYTLTATNTVGSTPATTQVTVNSAPTYSLSVNHGAGITGTPSASNTYAQGTVVSYSYSLLAGYTNLQVTLDGNPVAASGSVSMNAAHALVVQAQPLAPTITNLSPTTGPAGTPIVVTGANFIGVTSVSVGGVPCTTFTATSSTRITAVVPAGPGGVIAVTTPGGTATSNVGFVMTTAITGFTPTSGAPGTSITITGSNFMGATSVTVGGRSTIFAVNSDSQITAVAPSGPTGGSWGGGSIQVTTPFGTATSSGSFDVIIPAPTITSFSPSGGDIPGAQIVISGTNFAWVTSVQFINGPATFSVETNSRITATVPFLASTGPIYVTSPGGTANSSTNFTVGKPTIMSFNPVSGPVGTTVVISGKFFSHAIQVTFNGTPAPFTVNSDSQITVTVPSGATSGLLQVIASASSISVSGTSSTSFTVN
jgi:hypothetical protein